MMFMFIACTNQETNESASPGNESQTKAEDLVYPYKVNFKNFKADNQKNTEVILNIWKYWDSNEIDKQADMWADSAEVHTWDGVYIKGNRDTLTESGKRFRNNFSSVVSSVNGVISFTGTNITTGKNENWATVWGKRVMVDNAGKADSIWLHEAWRLNDQRKIEVLFQFAAKIGPQ